MESALSRLKKLTDHIVSYELARNENHKRLVKLYEILKIEEKCEAFENIFEFKAMNLMGISLKEESLGMVTLGRYIQLLAIKAKKPDVTGSLNVSLGYFGKSDTIDPMIKDHLVEFVLRWRFEKSFMTLSHYDQMVKGLQKSELV